MSRSSPPSLSNDERHAYDEKGFLSLQAMTSKSDVIAIRTIAEKLVAERAGFKEGKFFDALGARDNEPPRFTQIANPHLFASELRSSEFARNAHAIARQLLGSDARFASDLFLIKPARTGGATPWHQDEAFRDPAYERHNVSFWLPLQPVDQTNGCMEFIAGSHRLPVLDHDLKDGDSRVHALECRNGFDPSAAIPCPLPMGGATLHASKTLHCAGANRSATPRYAYVMIFEVLQTAVAEPRRFPWQAAWNTDRQARIRQWRRSGGFALDIWRGLRKVGLRDPKRLADHARRFLSVRWKNAIGRGGEATPH